MAALGKKLRSIAGSTAKGLAFFCPGCKSVHVIYTEGAGALWQYDGNADAPTFLPSILVTYEGADAGQARGDHEAPPARCHSFVRGGNIDFLSDSTHALAGKVVPLPDWPYDPGTYGGIEE